MLPYRPISTGIKVEITNMLDMQSVCKLFFHQYEKLKNLAPVFSFTVKYCWASSLMSDIGVVCTVEPVILCTAIVALLIL